MKENQNLCIEFWISFFNLSKTRNGPLGTRTLVHHLLKIKKFKEIGDSKYIYKGELDKASFQHDMAYGDFKGWPRRTASDMKTNEPI